MATAQQVQNANIRDTLARPVAEAHPDIKLISHSNVFYWWPAWVAGFAVAMISYLQGVGVSITPKFIDRIHPSNNPASSLSPCSSHS